LQKKFYFLFTVYPCIFDDTRWRYSLPTPRKKYAKYTPDIPEKAFKLALRGFTDKEMVDFFDIAEQTWYNWQAKHPELTEAIERGKDEADAEVAHAIYRRATGYDYTEEVTHVIQGKIVKTHVKKHMPANPTSAIFFMKNRTRRKHCRSDFVWADVNKTEITGKDGGPIKTQSKNINVGLDLSDLTDEELDLLHQIGYKIANKDGKGEG